MNQLQVGFFSVGLDTYWPQFEELLDRLMGCHRRMAGLLSGLRGARAGRSIYQKRHSLPLANVADLLGLSFVQIG